jgi:hypothetical protein
MKTDKTKAKILLEKMDVTTKEEFASEEELSFLHALQLRQKALRPEVFGSKNKTKSS